jgi:hypothetical protein
MLFLVILSYSNLGYFSYYKLFLLMLLHLIPPYAILNYFRSFHYRPLEIIFEYSKLFQIKLFLAILP